MTFNKNSRKRNSRAIIDKANSLDQEISNYKTRANNLIGRLINDGEEDKTNRENFMEFLHLYLDHFEEIRYLDHYQWSRNNAVNFTNTSKIISLKQYIPGWNEFFPEDVTFEDCSYLWNIFFPYSAHRSTDRINYNCLWSNTDLRASNQQAAVPHPPSISEFQNTIIPLKSKPYIVAKDVIEECEKAKSTILNGKVSKTHDYSEIYNINDFRIIPRGNVVSYSKFNGKSSFGYNTYHVSTKNQLGTYQYARSLVVGNFRAGKIHFFCSDDKQTFGFGKITSSYVQTVRVSLKPEYRDEAPEQASPEFQASVYASDDKYWDCIYYASINFEFNYINGNSQMNLFSAMTDSFANDILRAYHTNLLSVLNVARENYQNALEIIRTDDNGKYDEYIKYLTNADYSTLEKAVTTNNTIINSVRDWINKRANDILKTVRDDLTAESYEGIISERMNKNYGSLYSWYAYDSLPLAEAYSVYKQKIKDGLYRFKAMLVAPVVVLDYTNEKNGGEEPVNPNFIDIDRERYQYYRMAGKSDDFVQNDIVYLLDDENPEFSARVTRVKDWVGSNNNQDILLKRLYLDKSVSSVYDVSTLRVVKQI